MLFFVCQRQWHHPQLFSLWTVSPHATLPVYWQTNMLCRETKSERCYVVLSPYCKCTNCGATVFIVVHFFHCFVEAFKCTWFVLISLVSLSRCFSSFWQATSLTTSCLHTQLTCCCEYRIPAEKPKLCFFGDFLKHPADKESQQGRHRERKRKRAEPKGVSVCGWGRELKGGWADYHKLNTKLNTKHN